MELSKEEILKLDEILKFLNNERFKNYDIEYIENYFKIPIEEYQFLYNYICNFSINETDIGNVIDKGLGIECDYRTDKFIRNGGFKEYYKMKKERELEKIKPTIIAENYIGGNNHGIQSSRSELKKVKTTETIHPQPKEIKENPIISFISKFWWKILIPISIVIIGILIELILQNVLN
jgi:hypothetical protein